MRQAPGGWGKGNDLIRHRALRAPIQGKANGADARKVSGKSAESQRKVSGKSVKVTDKSAAS